MKQTDFLQAGTNSGKLKVDSMIFGRVWLKISVGHWTLSGMKFNTSSVIWSSNRWPVPHKILVSF